MHKAQQPRFGHREISFGQTQAPPKNVTDVRSTIYARPRLKDMALTARVYDQYWQEEISEEDFVAFKDIYQSFPRCAGPRTRVQVWSAEEVFPVIFGPNDDEGNRKRLRLQIRQIFSSYIRFHFKCEPEILSKEDYGNLQFWVLDPQKAFRISNAIYDCLKDERHSSSDDFDPKYLTGWLWESRRATLRGQASTESRVVLPSIQDFIRHQ
ncbi:hypothetical protein TWF481_010636 [Arthrobotrys musiformis]|uniref:RGS domain-containing protein n=1 Tax=Arthrobotrys musiformis TaxID=47236 RepID=A0AAV9W7B3_9PEZI